MSHVFAVIPTSFAMLHGPSALGTYYSVRVLQWQQKQDASRAAEEALLGTLPESVIHEGDAILTHKRKRECVD